MSAEVLRIARSTAAPADDGVAILVLLDERARVAARLADLDGAIAGRCRAFSAAHGYRVTLRPDQVRRALAAQQPPAGALGQAPAAPAVHTPRAAGAPATRKAR